LAGNNSDRAGVAEQSRLLARTRRRLAALLLARDDARDVTARAIVRLSSPNGLSPGLLIGGIAGKERRDRFEVVGVVGRQPPDPGKTANVDRYAHGSL